MTQSSSSSLKDLTILCKVENLYIDGNLTIGEDHTLFDILSHPSSLKCLSIVHTRLSSSAAASLFTKLAKGNILRNLEITIDNPTDETYDVITATMKDNTSLVCLEMSTDNVSENDIHNIMKALHLNNTVQKLVLNTCLEDVKGKITVLQDIVNKKRESRGCQVKLCIEFVTLIGYTAPVKN